MNGAGPAPAGHVSPSCCQVQAAAGAARPCAALPLPQAENGKREATELFFQAKQRGDPQMGNRGGFF